MLATLPGVLFTMRYPDNTGFVWNTIARLRDQASAKLGGHAACYLAYPSLTGSPSYVTQHATPVELDVYDNSPQGRERTKAFVQAQGIKVIIFMSAQANEVDLAGLRALGVRTLNTENNSFDTIAPDPLPLQLVKKVLRGILGMQTHDLHLANSKAQAHFLLSHAKLPRRKVVVMVNSVDCERYSPGPRADALAITGLAPERRWIVCVSQSRPVKRLDAIVRVAQAVIAARPDADIGFVYVGEGECVASCQALAASLGLGDRFVFAGRQNELAPFYRSSDLLVHAAETESFGLAVVEAMACGIPAIASAAAGPSETIIDHHTGRLIDLHDFDAFARAVIEYIDQPELRAEHARNARAHAVAQFSMQRQATEMAGYIRRFL